MGDRLLGGLFDGAYGAVGLVRIVVRHPAAVEAIEDLDHRDARLAGPVEGAGVVSDRRLGESGGLGPDADRNTSAVDYWPQVGGPLSERARAAIAGGGHLHGPEDTEPSAWMCEAIAVAAAADRPLQVRARTSTSPFAGDPTIAVLEVDLGLPWPGPDDGELLRLGDLPVDPCGMVLGDVLALDGFTGLDGQATDGLADVAYGGKYEGTIHAQFGGDRIPQHPSGHGPHGWLDLPSAEAEAVAERLRTWTREDPDNGLVVSVAAHTDFHRCNRAGWNHPLLADTIDLDACQVLGLGWDSGDHSMRHHGERAYGQVYPATLEARAGEAVLRWSIPPYEPDR